MKAAMQSIVQAEHAGHSKTVRGQLPKLCWLLCRRMRSSHQMIRPSTPSLLPRSTATSMPGTSCPPTLVCTLHTVLQTRTAKSAGSWSCTCTSVVTSALLCVVIPQAPLHSRTYRPAALRGGMSLSTILVLPEPFAQSHMKWMSPTLTGWCLILSYYTDIYPNYSRNI
jgi:hypothetical protein